MELVGGVGKGAGERVGKEGERIASGEGGGERSGKRARGESGERAERAGVFS